MAIKRARWKKENKMLEYYQMLTLKAMIFISARSYSAVSLDRLKNNKYKGRNCLVFSRKLCRNQLGRRCRI